MPTINIRRQGGAAIMTIPAEVMKDLGAGIGTTLDLSVVGGVLEARPRSAAKRKRFTMDELMTGVTPDVMRSLVEDTEWARAGDPVGQEF